MDSSDSIELCSEFLSRASNHRHLCGSCLHVRYVVDQVKPNESIVHNIGKRKQQVIELFYVVRTQHKQRPEAGQSK